MRGEEGWGQLAIGKFVSLDDYSFLTDAWMYSWMYQNLFAQCLAIYTMEKAFIIWWNMAVNSRISYLIIPHWLPNHKTPARALGQFPVLVRPLLVYVITIHDSRYSGIQSLRFVGWFPCWCKHWEVIVDLLFRVWEIVCSEIRRTGDVARHHLC